MASKQSTCKVCEMSKSIVPKDFYVYVHRTLSGQVFYVGKGCGQRAWSNSRNDYWHRVVKKHGLLVEIIAPGLQEWYAFELELELIAKYGRENLCNLTDGGEGASGQIQTEKTKQQRRNSVKDALSSPVVRAKISSALTLYYSNEDNLNKLKLRTIFSWKKPERIEKQRIALVKANIKNKQKRIDALTVIKSHLRKPVTCVEKEIDFPTTRLAENWLKSIGFLKAKRQAIRGCCIGKIKSAYGYTWRYA